MQTTTTPEILSDVFVDLPREDEEFGPPRRCCPCSRSTLHVIKWNIAVHIITVYSYGSLSLAMWLRGSPENQDASNFFMWNWLLGLLGFFAVFILAAYHPSITYILTFLTSVTTVSITMVVYTRLHGPFLTPAQFNIHVAVAVLCLIAEFFVGYCACAVCRPHIEHGRRYKVLEG